MGCGSSREPLVINPQPLPKQSLTNIRTMECSDDVSPAYDVIDGLTDTKALEASSNEASTAKQSDKPKKRPKHDISQMDIDDAVNELELRMHRLSDVQDYASAQTSDDLEFVAATARIDPSVKRFSKQDYRPVLAKRLVLLNVTQLFKTIWKQQLPLIENFEKLTTGMKSMKAILVVLWNTTDYFQLLCDQCKQEQITNDVLEHLNTEILSNLSGTSNSKQVYFIKGLMGILHNLLQRVDVREDLRNNNAIAVIQKYQNQHGIDVKLKCKVIMVLAYLMNEDENEHLNADDKNIAFIIAVLKDSLQNDDHFSPKYGYSAVELLHALNLLSSNESNKRKIVDNGALQYYVRSLKNDGSNSVDEQKRAAQGIWSLAFLCKEEIKEEPGLIEALENLADHSSDAEVVKETKGALWVIHGMKGMVGMDRGAGAMSRQRGLEQSDADLDLNEDEDDSDMPHVMISYQWGVQSTMLTVRDRLKAAGYKVWMDVDEMSGSILEAMALAVEKAAVVLVCMTQKYKDSNNCRTEAEYTFRLQRPIVPLRLEPKYMADGWLGAMVGNKLYFDLTRPESFDTKLNDLMKELGGRGRVAGTGKTPLSFQSGDPPIVKNEVKQTTSPPKPIKDEKVVSGGGGAAKWSESQTRDWLTREGLGRHATSFAGFDGCMLLELKQMLTTAPEFFYTTLKEDMHFPLLQILKFTKALKQLS